MIYPFPKGEKRIRHFNVSFLCTLALAFSLLEVMKSLNCRQHYWLVYRRVNVSFQGTCLLQHCTACCNCGRHLNHSCSADHSGVDFAAAFGIDREERGKRFCAAIENNEKYYPMFQRRRLSPSRGVEPGQCSIPRKRCLHICLLK